MRIIINMAEKEFRPVSSRTENIIKGLFTILLSVVVSINVGKIGRTLSFPLLYFLGAAYYLLIAFAIFAGGYRLVKKQKLKITDFKIVIGIILALLGFVIIISYISFKANGQTFTNIDFIDLITRFNGQLETYYSDKIINVFSSDNLYSLGLIGTLICGLVANDAIILFLGIIILIMAALCFVWNLIFIHKDKRTREQKRQEKEAARKQIIEQQRLEEENNPVISRRSSIYDEEPITHDISQDVSYNHELEPAKIEPGFEREEEPVVNENSGFDYVGGQSLDEIYGKQPVKQETHSEYNEFTPLVFSADDNPFNYYSTPKQVTPVQPVQQQVEETPLDEIQEEEEEINLIDSRPVTETKQEERPINEELVMAQTVFAEIVEKKEEPVQPVQQQVVVEQPKPKKRERVVWIAPSPELLMTYETQEARERNEMVANERMLQLNKILEDFKTGARCVGYTIGSSVTRFSIDYDTNVTVRTVEKLDKDISRKLGGLICRFVPIIPNEPYSGLEIPNATVTTVGFKEVFTALPDVKKHPLAVAFGKDIAGNVVYADYNDFPHLLVAGTTGSGKSIYVHSVISTLIMRVSPDDLKVVLVDPKKVEMTKYRDMPHLLCPIITEAEKAKVCLDKLVDEMEKRYEMFSVDPEISDIKQYNAWAKENNADPIPYILVVLDEYADLVDNCKEISMPVVSIAQKARSCGIHLLISTQRPSTNVITGVIKGNLPTRVALLTSSYTDSMTIIGEVGSEALLGKGDMLVQSPLISRTGVTRLQGCFVQNKEIVHIVNYLKEHYETHYDENYLDLVDHSKEPAVPALALGEVEKESSAEEENKYQSIKEWVMTQEFVSMSKIQRECSVGFNRAGRFFTRLQKEGIVATTQDGSSKGCKVLVHDKFYSGDGDDDVGSGELIG